MRKPIGHDWHDLNRIDPILLLRLLPPIPDLLLELRNEYHVNVGIRHTPYA